MREEMGFVPREARWSKPPANETLAQQHVLIFQVRVLRGDQTQNDRFARRQKPQRFETTGAFAVVLQQEPVDVNAAQDLLGDALVAGKAPAVPAIVEGPQ